MNFESLKLRIRGFSNNRSSVFGDDEILLEKANISLMQVCRDSIPLNLLVKYGVLEDENKKEYKLLREIDGEYYLRYPRAINATDDIELSDNLMDPLALHILSGIEVSRAPVYMKMYWSILERYENDLINGEIRRENAIRRS